jgi:Xaa-Pro aminopeptidase
MKSDIDQLMEDHGMDAILVTGPAKHNPAMYYFTGGAHLTHADLIKKRGEEPILLYAPMERDEAAKTGLSVRNYADYPLQDLLKESDGDVIKAAGLRYKKIFEDLGITSGRISVYGKSEVGRTFATYSYLQEIMPGITLIGEGSDSMLLQAMATKDMDEIENIRSIGEITVAIVDRVADFLTTQNVKDDVLVTSDDEPITVADVKSLINLWLAEMGAENPEGTIFAIGRDSGVPHSAGDPEDAIRLGKTIVFDIFPCQSGGGYFFDFTRTWCLGYATDEAQSLYEDVLGVYTQIMSELKGNTLCKPYQKRTCELFEERGHPTIKQDAKIQEGYVHSLGHGLGLHVHERPWFGQTATEDDKLSPGVVVTIEPGLYYPEREMGCRLENTVWVTQDNNIEVMVEYPLDFVLPMSIS